MNAQCELIPGTNRDVSKSQWFTPPELAQRVVEWAEVGCRGCACHTESAVLWPRPQKCCRDCPPMRVLEPSAGNGALVRPLVAAGAHVTAVEIDLRYFGDLNSLGCALTWREDFLILEPHSIGKYDLCVMNPPYENGMDVAFVLHALKFAPRVVGIFRSQILHGKARKRDLWAHVRPTRIAYLSERPDFGGDYGAMTDFVVLELVKRDEYRYIGQGESRPVQLAPDTCTIEWW